jgi:hypothetical protein
MTRHLTSLEHSIACTHVEAFLMDRGILSLDSGYGTHVEVDEALLMTWHLIYGVYLMIVNLLS